jgi:hypothetical protein
MPAQSRRANKEEVSSLRIEDLSAACSESLQLSRKAEGSMPVIINNLKQIKGGNKK